MFTGFVHAQLISTLWPVIGIAPNSLAAAASVNTYGASPQPAAGIDTWIGGGALFSNMLMLVNVASVGTGGTLAVSLYDSATALTTANGAATAVKVADLATISAAGLYYAEFQFTHVFGETLARYVADEENITVRRYHNVRATAAVDTVLFDVICIYGFNQRDYPVQDANELTITWVAA